jgi:predicted small secreted protein
MKNLSKTVLLAALAVSAIALAACNTTKGIGKDIENTGDAIEDSADKHGAE